MDRRKLQQQIDSVQLDESPSENAIKTYLNTRRKADDDYDIQEVINSKRVNESLLINCKRMFDAEFEIKMMAQLKYMEKNERRKTRRGFWAGLKHDYFWSPTTTYYLGAMASFMLVRKRLNLNMFHMVPFMFLPITADYMKREYYVQMADEGVRKEVESTRKVV